MGESRIIPQAPNRRTTDLEILAEVPSTLGLVLWQDLRHVRDWAEDASKRERLFPPRLNDRVVAKRIEARVLEPELDEALAALGRLLESPTSTPASMVAEACVAVVQWAERVHLTASERLARLTLAEITSRQRDLRGSNDENGEISPFVYAVMRRLAEWSPTRAAREPRTLARSEWAA